MGSIKDEKRGKYQRGAERENLLRWRMQCEKMAETILKMKTSKMIDFTLSHLIADQRKRRNTIRRLFYGKHRRGDDVLLRCILEVLKRFELESKEWAGGYKKEWKEVI